MIEVSIVLYCILAEQAYHEAQQMQQQQQQQDSYAPPPPQIITPSHHQVLTLYTGFCDQCVKLVVRAQCIVWVTKQRPCAFYSCHLITQKSAKFSL